MRFARHGGEANQIIYDDVDGAAYVVALDAGHVQRFGPDSLSRKCSVAVHDDRNDRLRATFTDARLLRARTSDGDWVDRFEVAGIRYQMHSDVAAVGCGEFAGCADVVFHVAAAENAARIHIFEFRENFGGRTADDVHHHVEPAAMAHRQDGLLRVVLGRGIEDRIEQRQKRDFAFERIALGAEIARLKNLLENFRADEAIENCFLVRCRCGRRFRFHALLRSSGAARDRGCA